jgi:two-component system chemotaxis sensor kinase CheA
VGTSARAQVLPSLSDKTIGSFRAGYFYSQLTREFLIESQEGLDRMERCLTDLEERPEDAALLADIFRSVHTIKGTTGFLGFKRLEMLAHAGENLLGLLREVKLVANPPIITGLLQLLDGLRSILKTIEAEGLEGDGTDAALIANLEHLQQPAKEEASCSRPSRNRTHPRRADHARRPRCPTRSPPLPQYPRQPLLSTFLPRQS